MSKWTEKDIPDLTGKVVIITGANSGLGFENTRQFAMRGATVIMACRSLERGQKALDKIRNKVPEANIELMQLDLGSLESVKKFVKIFREKYSRLDILLNNAGIMMVPYMKTTDGFESQIGINHLGHFALTALLYDLLKATDGSRIVNVSSNAHKFGKVDWDDFLFEKKYSRTAAYGRSKLANLLFTYELDRRFREKGVPIKVMASHPGGAVTGLADHILGPFKFLKYPLHVIMRLFMMQSAAAGALPSARAATDPDVSSGEYYGPKGFFGGELRGAPKRVESTPASHNIEDTKKLWELSEQLTGIRFEI